MLRHVVLQEVSGKHCRNWKRKSRSFNSDIAFRKRICVIPDLSAEPWSGQLQAVDAHVGRGIGIAIFPSFRRAKPLLGAAPRAPSRHNINSESTELLKRKADKCNDECVSF